MQKKRLDRNLNKLQLVSPKKGVRLKQSDETDNRQELRRTADTFQLHLKRKAFH
jgi:hypothetical protein